MKAIAARGETAPEGLIELVRHAQSANQIAVDTLVRHYQIPAVRVAQNIVGDLLVADDAEDEDTV